MPPVLISKGLPLRKQIDIPMAMGALASLGDNLVDKVFGEGGKRIRGKKFKQSRRAVTLNRKVKQFLIEENTSQFQTEQGL